MIANDIQELFDGSLPDEQTAELLHALSVSPERRAEFRQFMALKNTIRKDREVSALTPEEDAFAWRGIAASVGLGLPTRAVGTRGVAVAGRLAAVALVGVLGYAIGISTVSTSVDNAPRASTPSTSYALSIGSDRVRTLLAGSLPLSAVASHDTVRLPIDRVVYRDRWRERVRLVERAVPVPVEDLSPTVPNASNADGAQTVAEVTSRVNAETARVWNKEAIARAKEVGATEPLALDARREPSLFAKGSLSDSTVVAQRTPTSNGPSPAHDLPVAALQRGGIEVGYNERVGRLAALPRGDAKSATYASRYLDLSYRFDMGRYGLGLRFGQGTFSSVTLVGDQMVRRDGAVSRIDTVYRPSIGETRETTVEFFANYRFPLTDRFALGAEMAYNRSTTHEKLGGDLFALWFLTDRIGLQIGGGLSHYWYDLSGERQRLLEKGENVGVSDDALDSYTGSVFEGRYGLFYTF